MDPVQELKKVCDDLGTAFGEFKKEVNAQIAKGVKDALSEAKVDALNQRLDDLTGKKEDLEKRIKLAADWAEETDRKLNLLRKGGGATDDVEQKALVQFNAEVRSVAISRGMNAPEEVSLEGFRAYKTGFTKYLRKGDKVLSSEEHKALSVGVDADGGFLVPADMGGRIINRVRDLSPIRSIANVQSIGSDRLEGIEDLDEADAGWVSELGTRSDTTTPNVGKYELVAEEMYAQPKASQKLLDDSSIDIEAWLSGKVADKFARVEGAAFCVGNGVGKPRGLASYTTAATADATRAWGQLEHVKSGANGAFNTNQADPLFDLIAAFKPAYLQNARWVTKRSVIAAIRKFKTTTTLEYIWQPGLQQGQPQVLLGYPIVVAEDMPALGTGSLSLALGDFNAGYQIVDRLGVRVLRDPFTDKPYVKFYSIRRTGGGVTNFEAIKFIQFAS